MTRIHLIFTLLVLSSLFLACTSSSTEQTESTPTSTNIPVSTEMEAEALAEEVSVGQEKEAARPTTKPASTAPKGERKLAVPKSIPRPKLTPNKKTSGSSTSKPAPISSGPTLSVPPKSMPAPPKATAVKSPPPRPKTVEAPKRPAAPKKPTLSHDAWDGILKKYVSSTGKVNYASLKANKSVLNSYLQTLADNPPQGDWGRNKSIAYWINVYNAFTVKLIIDNYPVKSIMDLDGGNPWAKKWIKIGNKTLSLNEIEKDYLIKRFKEPRVHFAVNCATKSCPPLLNRAWTEGNLSANFERQAKSFINNDRYNSISEKSADLSKIFEWYAGDFGNVVDFINKYSEVKLLDKTKITYKEYDWGLNQ